jgi:hypothetical protein
LISFTSADRPEALMLDGPHWVRLSHRKTQQGIALFVSRHFGLDAISICTEGILALHGMIYAFHLQIRPLKYLPGRKRRLEQGVSSIAIQRLEEM